MAAQSSKVSFTILLLVLLYIQFFHRLGGLGLVGPDEPRYAQVAKEMLASGDYITPHLYGKPWFEKPALYYWLTSASYKIFGVSEFSARLVSVLAALVGVGLVFLVGRDWLGLRGAMIAVCILATSALYFSLARAASMDMLLTATLTGAWTSLYLVIFGKANDAASPHKASVFWTYGFYIFMALSLLAKGPVGLILVGSSFLLFLLINRDLPALWRMQLIPGLLLFAAISLPWYWLCYKANGYAFVQDFLIQHNLERFATDRYKHAQPFWFYLGVLLAGFFPWILQAGQLLGRILQKRFGAEPREKSRQLFFALWVLVPLIFFSFSRAKLPGYLLPVAPALALLIAHEFERFLNENQSQRERKWFFRSLALQSGTVGILGLSLPWTAGRLNVDIGALVPELTTVLIALAIGGGFLVRRHKIAGWVAIHVVGIALVVSLITLQLFPRIDASESSRQLAAAVKHGGYARQPIFLLEMSRRTEYGLNFYLDSAAQTINSVEELKSCTIPELFLITPLHFEPGDVPKPFQVESDITFRACRVLRLRALPPPVEASTGAAS